MLLSRTIVAYTAYTVDDSVNDVNKNQRLSICFAAVFFERYIYRL